ncbi:hypothetical protein EUGRSUZ_K02725 [Eucalyptus grandis]|uniref:Uncharacterized protein n=2 Tax=Eucalyptus grandis TaxID=71139 RepID=A0ACC3IYU8_EUCGR|nr:hypothetical protein EUGRSUZ_K02725 [Eucalyptus grandis]
MPPIIYMSSTVFFASTFTRELQESNTKRPAKEVRKNTATSLNWKNFRRHHQGHRSSPARISFHGEEACLRSAASSSRSEPLPTRLAGDLHAGRVDLPRRPLLHPLRPIHLLPRPLPHVPRPRELRLRQLHLPPRELPHPLRVRLLYGGEPDLLRRLPLQGPDVIRLRLGVAAVFTRGAPRDGAAVSRGADRAEADGELQVEGGG